MGVLEGIGGVLGVLGGIREGVYWVVYGGGIGCTGWVLGDPPPPPPADLPDFSGPPGPAEPVGPLGRASPMALAEMADLARLAATAR